MHDNFGKAVAWHSLFHAAAPEEPVFSQVLEKFFGGRQDEKTLRILKAGFRTR